MMIAFNLASLFDLEPKWGLRGDPFLWREMKGKFESSKNIKTVTDFEVRLHELFLKLTNCKPKPNTSIFIERYSFGGMSSGQVSAEFWLETGFPLLITRFKELHGG